MGAANHICPNLKFSIYTLGASAMNLNLSGQRPNEELISRILSVTNVLIGKHDLAPLIAKKKHIGEIFENMFKLCKKFINKSPLNIIIILGKLQKKNKTQKKRLISNKEKRKNGFVQ